MPETVGYGAYSMGPRVSITLGSSPAALQNTTSTRIMILLTGGTVSLLEFSRDSISYDAIGSLLSGSFFLNPGDWMRVTYAISPAVVYYPV
jgi:hypothetical protein